MSDTNGSTTNGTTDNHDPSGGPGVTRTPVQPQTLNQRERELALNHMERNLARQDDLVENFYAFSRQWIGNQIDPRRNLFTECGWPAEPTIDMYRNLYEREPLATRVVEVYPKECWQQPPTVFEDMDVDTVTDFEEAWDKLGSTLKTETSYHVDETGSGIWDELQRADILSRIGSYGVILLGIDDGKNLQEPLDGVMVLNERTKLSDSPMTPEEEHRLLHPYGRWSATDPDALEQKQMVHSGPDRVGESPLSRNQLEHVELWRWEREYHERGMSAELAVNTAKKRMDRQKRQVEIEHVNPCPHCKQGWPIDADPKDDNGRCPSCGKQVPIADLAVTHNTKQLYAEVLAKSPQHAVKMVQNQVYLERGWWPKIVSVKVLQQNQGRSEREPEWIAEYSKSDAVENENPNHDPANGEFTTGGGDSGVKEKTGSGFAVKPPKKLYRGVTEDGKGAGTFSLGKGLYSTPSKSFLKGFKYAKIVELDPETAFPRNPLVLHHPSEFSDWLLKESGHKRMSEFGKQYNDPGEFVKSKGYDGVIAGDEVVKYSAPIVNVAKSVEAVRDEVAKYNDEQLDGLKVRVNDVLGKAIIDRLDWYGKDKNGFDAATAIGKVAEQQWGKENVHYVNEAAKPIGPDWITLNVWVWSSSQETHWDGTINDGKFKDENTRDATRMAGHRNPNNDEQAPTERAKPLNPNQRNPVDAGAIKPGKRQTFDPTKGPAQRQGDFAEVFGTDQQYDDEGYGIGMPPPAAELGYSLSGTDEQYFGVQFGPSEQPAPPTDPATAFPYDGGSGTTYDQDGRAQQAKQRRPRLLFMRPYSEDLVQVVRYEWNIRNPRFGYPVMYRITLNDPRETQGGVGLPLATVFVHWSRVIHLCDRTKCGGVSSNPVFTIPSLKPVFNSILDAQKVCGAGAEGYYKSCFDGDTKFFDSHELRKLKDCVDQEVVVTCADGEKRIAIVRSFGVRKFIRIELGLAKHGGGSRGKFKRSVIATRDHRWVLTDGRVTTVLKVGDVLAASHFAERKEPAFDAWGFAHGVVFGDGWIENAKYGTHQTAVRLFGEKRWMFDKLKEVATHAHEDGGLNNKNPLFKGLPVLRFTNRETNMKALPDANKHSEAYTYWFLQGWFATDGHKYKHSEGLIGLSTSKVVAVEWFLAHAPYYGYEITGYTVNMSLESPGIGTQRTIRRNSPNYLIRCKKQRIGYEVRSIADEGLIGESYCVVEPVTKSFTLEGGVVTGNCFTGLQFATNPQMGPDVMINEANTMAALEEYQNGLRRGFVSVGGEWKTIAPTVLDPTPHYNLAVEKICIVLGCPVRIFKGSERGELASSQDDESWNKRRLERQVNYLTPRVIVPLIDRLIQVGVLPTPGAKSGKQQVQNILKRQPQAKASRINGGWLVTNVRRKQKIANVVSPSVGDHASAQAVSRTRLTRVAQALAMDKDNMQRPGDAKDQQARTGQAGGPDAYSKPLMYPATAVAGQDGREVDDEFERPPVDEERTENRHWDEFVVNDDGHWVTTEKGQHLFLSGEGGLHTSPGGQQVGKAKGTEKPARPPKAYRNKAKPSIESSSGPQPASPPAVSDDGDKQAAREKSKAALKASQDAWEEFDDADLHREAADAHAEAAKAHAATGDDVRAANHAQASKEHAEFAVATEAREWQKMEAAEKLHEPNKPIADRLKTYKAADNLIDMAKKVGGKGTSKAEIAKKIHDSMKPDNPIKFDARTGGLEGRNKARADMAVDFLHTTMEGSTSHISGTTHKALPPDGRAFYRIEERSVNTSMYSEVKTHVHELGHHLEDAIPGVKEAVTEFLQHRVGNEQPTKMTDVCPQCHYGEGEEGRKDNFDKAFDENEAYYIGKSYASGQTEILSMGIEKFYHDPVTFAKKDPEYFKFIHGIMSGRLRKSED